MARRDGCGQVALGALFVLVACLVFAALAGALILTGEVPIEAPQLKGIEPAADSALRPTTPLTLTFDQPMDPASVESSLVWDPPVAGTFQWNEDFTQVTFLPDGPGYEPGMSYTVRLAKEAKAGTLPMTMARAHEQSFSLPPLLDTLEPVPGADNLGPMPVLQATFHYALDCAATSLAFAITPDARGELECEDDTVAFRPTLPLAADTAYVANLDAVYLEGDATPRPGVGWSFRTAPPLRVEEVSPAPDGLVTDLWTAFRITFNRPVVQDSVTARFSLLGADAAPLAGQWTWDLDGAGFLFQPEEPLKPASQVRLMLLRGVQDDLGFELAEPMELDLYYETAPMLGKPFPAPGAKDVALDSSIRVPFTRPMDQASVEAGLAISPALAGKMAWEENTLVFTPRGGLASQTVYQISLTADVRDHSGAPLGETSQWAFTTQPFLLDARPPSETHLTELLRPIEFVFALSMDRASVEAALTISPTTPGELLWSDDGRAVTFQPEPAWLPGAEYEILLSASARTADGYQTLGEDRAYAFSTGVAEVRFGTGPNVQVFAADGERTFEVIARGADVANLSLIPITPTQFLDLYRFGFRGVGLQDSQILDTTGLTPTVEWREVLTPLEERHGDEWQPAEAHLPTDVPPGLYVLAADPPAEEQSRLLVVLTRHALVLKRAVAGTGNRARAQVLAWDTEISGGRPVISATVRLYDHDGSFLAEGITDQDGLLALDVPADPEPLLALAFRDGAEDEMPPDVTVCGLGDEWTTIGWWGQETSPPTRPLYLIMSYTDRPIYRPAQTVYFKNLVRIDDDASYTLPSPDSTVTVRLRDGRDNIAATRVLTPTGFGTVHGALQLADEPMLGTWTLETEVEADVTRHPFRVEEYRKPEYEVTVHTPQTAYVHGEAMSVTVDAAYYFGRPVTGAEVVLLAYPIYADDLVEGDGLPFAPPVFSEEGRTDDQGRWSLTLPTEEVAFGQVEDQRMVLALEATVTDDTGLSVSNYQAVVVQRTSQGLTLLLERHGYQPNEEVTLAAVVRDREGEPVAGVELTAEFVGWDDKSVATATATTDDAGQVGFSVRLAEQGWYKVRVGGIDDGGRVMVAEEYLWVVDPTGQAPWYEGRWGEEAALNISADREVYAVGDEAQVVVYTPVSGPALLSFERGEVRDVQPITLTAGTNLLTVAVRADYAPNIHVTVSQFGPLDPDLWEDQSRPEAQLQRASTQLLVPMTDRLLTVTLTTDQETVGPGDEATFHLQVVDHQGQPVAAEVSMAVVDEAIYALAEDVGADPFDVLYGPRPNLVRTFDSLRPTRWLYPEEPGLGGPGEEEAGIPRRDFMDTAHWAPTLVTDENGEATITVELPDNLTEWRAVARAVTTDTLVGQATTHLVVSQELVLRPGLPRFLTQGDGVTLTAVVHNFTTQPVSATMQLDLEGLTLLDDAQQVVHLPAGGAAPVDWSVVAEALPTGAEERPGEARVVIRATASRGTRLVGRDAVELSLPVVALAVPEITPFAGELTPAKPTETLTLTLPTDVLPDLSRLEIRLAPSLAPGLLQGLEYLIGYPYGCVEQTLSRMLPNAVVGRAFRDLGIRNELLETDLPPMVELGLQKLYGFQHNDGGWGWWYDDSTEVHQTAYVLFGLSMTEQAGFAVHGGVLERGAEALRRLLPGADPREQAYGAYVLAMAAQPVSITLSLTDALELDLFSQAALAIALDIAGGPAVASGSAQAMVDALLDNLREAAIQADAVVHWEEEGEDVAYSRAVMGSAVRTSAMVVDALVRLDPGGPLLPGAIRWLMEQRQGQGWGDTQRTSHAILALTGYLLASQQRAPAEGQAATVVAYQIQLNGELWQEGLLGMGEVGQTLNVPVSALLPGENQVQLALGEEQEPSGRLYYDLTLTAMRAPEEGRIDALQAQARSIGVRREYRLRGSREPATQFQVGDLVEVQLTLDVPEESRYVLIDDPLPAGFEALNERLGTTSHVAGDGEDPFIHWDKYGYNRKEVRDERVTFFVSGLGPGERTLTYLVRATAAGSFTALPTQVYPMYEPEVWSRSDSAVLLVEAR